MENPDGGGLIIGLDVAGAAAPQSGIGRYTVHLARSLAESPRVEELRMFRNSFRSAFPPALDGVPGERVNPRWPDRILLGAWNALGWPPIDAFTGTVDVFHTSDWVHPPQKGGVSVTTVHDLAPLIHSEWYSGRVVSIHRRKNEAAVKRADQIIAISGATRDALLEFFPELQPERISVVHHGIDGKFTPQSEGTVAGIRKRYLLPRPFLLYVGTREARKNLMGLLRIYRRIQQRVSGIDLALAGPRPFSEAHEVDGVEAWTGRELEATIAEAGLEERVRILGSVPGADLPGLYSAAEAFVYPTLYEGFGFPALEAMACGTPVVGSSRTAVPEVIGDGGVVHDPGDEAGFAEEVCRILEDVSRSEGLGRRGLARASEFSWPRAASETVDAYMLAMERARP